MIYKYLLCMVGFILALPLLFLICFSFVTPITMWGIGYLLAGLLAILGLLIAPWKFRYSSLLIYSGVGAIILIVSARILLGMQNTTSSLRMITLPQAQGTSWVSYLIDEQDSVIFGEALFHLIGGDSRIEHEGVTAALYADYAEMRTAQRIFPSPFMKTYLGLQRSASFDAMIIEPKIKRHPEIGVVFLHGFMGNVTVQCWEIARAVEGLGAVTICPSTSWTGEWWQPQGQAIIEATFSYLRGQGIRKFYLGGFSNGGFGISRLASQLKNEAGISGLFFIDGIYDGENIRATGLPVLVIQGMQDERMPAVEARRIAQIIGDSGIYVELPGDHFIIMKRPDLVQNAISTWLEAHQSSQ